MGIHQLNYFIRSKCDAAIKVIGFSQLSGKKIVVDTSIYMYKYAKEGNLIEGMFRLISTLLYYKISPVFIFDGKPPPEKENLLADRRRKKKEAEYKYNELKQSLTRSGKNVYSIENNKQLQLYKKAFTRIRSEEINDIKEMMTHFGVEYYDADNEADKLCVSLVLGGYAWACLSEDTDMFVYGCPRILRYISLMANNVVIYDLYKILKILNITQDEFVKICVFTGTDYNVGVGNIHNIYKKFIIYKKEGSSYPMHEWMNKTMGISGDKKNYENICNMFNVGRNYELTIRNNKENYPMLKAFLENYNFIFLNSLRS
uniref:XPG N-terminal domain-containing protein n=1 Tax=viral metagenome TaxID=1070528 RepID=A0A6C0BYT6_9ZZZZ